MIIDSSPCGPFDTNSYLITCPETREACIIDPGVDSLKWLQSIVEIRQAKPVLIVLTHSHWDHIGQVAAAKAHWQIPLAIHPEDLPNLEKPGSDGLPCWLAIPAAEADRLLQDGDSVRFGNVHFQVLHTPGHSPGGICLYSPEEHVLISGDTLFKGTIGNLSFPTSSPERMWSSLERLALLPAETKVYPGHGEPTEIGAEKWLGRARELFGN